MGFWIASLKERTIGMADPILIVGAGPTGLTAALELTRLGIAVRLIDKRDAPATTSRAIGIQARTLELLAQRGLAEEMIRLGNKGTHGSIYGGGKRVFRLDFGHVDSPFPYMLFLSQAETERILREAIEAVGVVIEWKTALVGIAQDGQSKNASPVQAVIEGPDGIATIAVPWLISAEGAHSLVRATLDLQFEGKTLDEQYALGDLHIDGDLADSDFHIFSSEHGFMGLFPMGGGHFRMIASNPIGDPARGTPPSESELQRIYDQRSPIPARIRETSWTSWFRINSRMVPRLKVGRLLLGGDAAHIHSPAGGQGMNTGMQDMINLCWKLSLVMHGGAPERLLDTYEQDRLPVMRNVLVKTEGLTEMIGTENHLARTLFNHLGPWIGGADLVQAQATRRMSQIGLDYRGSPLADDHGSKGSLKAGDRIPPHIPVRHGGTGGWRDGRMADILDPSAFVLIIANEKTGADQADLRAAIERSSTPIQMVMIAPAEDRQAYDHVVGGSEILLIRPDGYVALTVSIAKAPDALRAFINSWLCNTMETQP
jgi:2-polyprenyl-6-methoxyphenol hydroxylase-like FAD-dependent oxidoreductase